MIVNLSIGINPRNCSVFPSFQDKLSSKKFTVHGHRDGGQTSCPGTAYYELIQDWPHYGGPLNSTDSTSPSGSDVIRQTSGVVAMLVILVLFAAFLQVAIV